MAKVIIEIEDVDDGVTINAVFDPRWVNPDHVDVPTTQAQALGIAVMNIVARSAAENGGTLEVT